MNYSILGNNSWICPKCNTAYAPWMPSCNCKSQSSSSGTNIPGFNVRESSGGSLTIPVKYFERKETPEEILNYYLADLPLSRRLICILYAENINTVKILISYNVNELLKIPNLSKYSIAEIARCLRFLNLRLKDWNEISEKQFLSGETK